MRVYARVLVPPNLYIHIHTYIQVGRQETGGDPQSQSRGYMIINNSNMSRYLIDKKMNELYGGVIEMQSTINGIQWVQWVGVPGPQVFARCQV